MILVILTAVLAVSEAAKLDRTYLPPITAKTADGSTAALRAPAEGLPSGSYINDDQGIVVDAASPNTRTAGAEPTGLGGPRTSYGSTASKVGDAAFRGSSNGFGSSGGANTRIAPGFGSVVGVDENAGGPSIRIAPGFSSVVASEGSDYDKTRASTLKFASEVGIDKYSYGFETDNGIAIGENGVAGDGINANGGYSYKGDDGKVYSVSYTADKDGYKPQGSHLPTPPPIPAEILVSLEQNAKDEAAGLIDDGSYDAQKYNDEGDYSSNTDNYNSNGPSVSADATASGSFGQRNQVNKPFDPYHTPGSGSNQAAVQNGSPNFGSHTFGKPQFGAAGLQGPPIQGTILPSPAPLNRFGVQSEKSDGSESSASAIASTGNNLSNFGAQNKPVFRLPTASNGNSAYSSAVTTGSGSASAFASTSPTGSGFKNEYLPPYFGSAGKLAQGSQPGLDSSAEVSAPTFETVNPDSSSSASASAQGQNAAVQTVVSGAPFGVGGLSSDKVPLPGYNGLNNNGFSKPLNSQTPQIGSNNANFGSSSSKPALSQQQGSDSSYYYNQPTKVFPTPSFISGKYPSNNRQPNIPVASSQGSIYSHSSNRGSVAPTLSSQPGQYQSETGTAFYNGITQASVSPFPSPSSTPSTQFGSQSSLFGSKPGTFDRKPIVQSQLEYSEQSSSQIDNSQSSTQQGTIYEYNKPNSYKETTSEVATSSKTDVQSSSGQKPIVNQGLSFGVSQTGSTFEKTESGSIFGTQFGQKPANTQGTNTGSKDQTQTSQFSSTSSVQSQSESTQIGQQPFNSQIDSEFQQTQFGISAGSEPSVQTGFNAQQAQFGSSVFQSTNPESIESNQGTLYEYNKPAETLPSNEQSSSQSVGIVSTTISPVQSISQVDPKPLSSQTAQGSSEQKQFGSTTETRFGQKPQPVQGSTYSSSSVTDAQASQFGEKPSTHTDSITFPSQVGEKQSPVSDFSSGSFSQDQPSNFGQKPLGSSQTQFGSTSQFSSSSSQLGQKQQTNQGAAQTPTSSFGQKPFGSSQTSSTFSQTAFSSSAGSQYGKKPQTTQSSLSPSSSASKGQSVQTQFGLKPIGSSQSHFGGTNQFGSSTSSQLGQKQQTTVSSFSQKPFGSSQTTFGASTGSKLSQKPHTSQGAPTKFGSTIQFGSSFGSQVGQKQETTSSFGQKPFGSSQTGSTFSQTAFGASTGSKFGQKPHTSHGTSTAFDNTSQFGSSSGSQIGQKHETTSSFGQKPFGSSQTGPTFSQTSFGSTTGSQVGQKQETTSSFGQKPLSTSQAGSTFSQVAFGSSTGSKFGLKPHTTSGTTTGFGYSSTGTHLGQKQDSTQGAGQISSTIAQTSSSFGQKPLNSTQSSSTLSQTAFGSSTGSKFGQKLHSSQGTSTVFGSTSQFGSSTHSQLGQKQQSGQGTGHTSASVPQTTSSLDQKPFGSVQSSFPAPQTSFGSSTGTKFGSTQTTSSFGQKPLGSSQTSSTFSQTAFGASTGSKFGQKPNTSNVASTAFGSTNQYGSSSGSQVGQKHETTSSFVQKPFGSSQTGSTFSQSAFGSTTGSKFGQKPQTTQGSSFTSSTASKSQSAQTQFGQKPYGTTQSQFGTSQLGSSSGSQLGQPQQTISSFGHKPFGSSQTSSSFSQTAFGSSSGSQNGQKASTGGASTAIGSTSNFGSSTGSQIGQKQESTSSFGQKPFGNSQTGSTFSSTTFGSSTGSKFGQKPQTSQISSTASNGQTTQTQFGQKPVGSTQSYFGSTGLFGNAAVTASSQLGQKQPASPSYGQKPFGSSPSSSSSQTAFGSSKGSKYGQKPQTTQGASTTFGSPSQFGSSTGAQNAGQTPGIVSQTTSPFGQKPFGSSQTTTFGSSAGSQFGQKPQTSEGSTLTSSSAFKGQSTQTQFGIKPFGSTQSHFGSTSKFGSAAAAANSQAGQKQQITSSFGQKPFGSLQSTSSASQTTFGSSKGSQYDQKPQTAQSATTTFGSSSQFGSSTGAQVGQKPETTSLFGQKPFGSSQTSSTLSQSAFGSSTGSQTSQGSSFTTKKPFVSSQLGSSTGSKLNQFGSQSQQGSLQQTQFGTSANSQFGQTTQTTSTFGQKPSSQLGFGTQQAQFSFNSGSGLSQNAQTIQGSSLPTSGVSNGQKEYTTQTGQKPLTSSQTTGSSFSQSQFGSTSESVASTGPQVQSIFEYGKKPVDSQSTQGFPQLSQFGSSTGSELGQNTAQGQAGQTQFSSFTGSSGGQKPLTSSQTTGSSLSQAQFGSTSDASTVPQVQSIFDYGKKPVDSQSTQGSPQLSQFGSSSGSQLGQNTAQGQAGQPQFGSFTGSSGGQKPLTSSQTTGSSFSQSQFGSTSVAFTGPQVQSIFDYGKKPVDSQSTLGSPQLSQFGLSTGSQFGQNTAQGSTGQTQFGKKPFGSSQTISSTFGSQFGKKPQTAFGYQNSQSSYFSQSSQANKADSKTQTPYPTQFSATDNKSSSSATAFASSGSFDSRTDIVEGYYYQKPQNPFKTPSSLGEQPTQAGFGQGNQINGVPISTPSTLDSFEQTFSSVGPAQIGDQNPFSSQNSEQSFSTAGIPVLGSTAFSSVQPTSPTLGQFDLNKKPTQTQVSFLDLQTASEAKYGAKPTQGVLDTSVQPSQNLGSSFNGLLLKPEFGSIFSTGFPTTVGSGTQDSSNLASAESPVITAISGIQNSFVGAGEQFGGPRNPPRFDEKTGYHY